MTKGIGPPEWLPEYEPEEAVLQRIKDCDAEVTVIGGGYVGLPLACRCARMGHRVTVVDPDEAKVESIRAGKSYIKAVSDGFLTFLVNTPPAEGHSPNLKAQTAGGIADADVILVCVPTPLNKTKDPDVSMVLRVRDDLYGGLFYLHKRPLVILESTVYPGFTARAFSKILHLANVAFSPERIDPGNPTHQFHNTPKLVGGLTEAAQDMAVSFYDTIVDEVVPVSSCEVAEMSKVFENTFRMVNIALVNEMALMCRKLGLDINEVVDAASTKPFGFMPFRPGPGVGGHCIGVDPHYLSWKLKTLNYHSRFIDLASQVNSHMPAHVVQLASEALNRVRRPLNDSHVLVVGVSYKPGVADTRESPALDILSLLRRADARVSYIDPFVEGLMLSDGFEVPRLDHETFEMIEEPFLAHVDCVIIVTDHPGVDHRAICRGALAVVDTRNATKAFKHEFPNKIVTL